MHVAYIIAVIFKLLAVFECYSILGNSVDNHPESQLDGIPTGRNPNWTESQLDGITTGQWTDSPSEFLVLVGIQDSGDSGHSRTESPPNFCACGSDHVLFFFFFLFFFPSDCENVVLALPCHKHDDGASHGVSHSS